MTRLWNDPARFVDEMVEGFVAANQRVVRSVRGGVARRNPSGGPGVAVVIGGGSGHYPAFAGFVGPGLAHAAVIGDVFASPSARQVYDVAREVERGGGVLLSYGNYAGDVLNFDQAQDRLTAEGISCRTVVVTDDISSAPPERAHARRGIAGDLVVFKIAGTAADQGRSLDEVADLAARANHRCRSLGVAFGGCTLPGAAKPLFDLENGRMAVGMGLHGEPGIREEPLPRAADLANLLVTKLLQEVPHGASTDSPLVVLLNGLGSLKYEELFVLYREVALCFHESGVKLADVRVGELITSFDMPGVSMTTFWPDHELLEIWTRPAETAAFCRLSPSLEVDAPGAPHPSATAEGSRREQAVGTEHALIPASSPDSRRAAGGLHAALQAVKAAIEARVDDLGRLDAVAGDGDHGLGMRRGADAAAKAAAEACALGAGASTTMCRAADAWGESAGGASGALWGVALRAFAEGLSDLERPTPADVSGAVSLAARAVISSGKANVGDKTMVDALVPFADSLWAGVREGVALNDAWVRAAEIAEHAAAATAPMIPRVGRARPLAGKSVGTPDPGATSFAVVVLAVCPAIGACVADAARTASADA